MIWRFWGICINPEKPLTNSKFINDIVLELSRSLRIQEQQKVLAAAWKPYIKNLETMCTDATCYESWMRYPTDAKLHRIVSANKPYVRPIVRGKEIRGVEFGAKCNNIQVDGLSFIQKLSFNAFNEGTELKHCVGLSQRLFGMKVKKIGGDLIYAGNDNRTFCRENGIMTSFVQKGRMSKDEAKNESRKTLAKVRATAMEGSFGTQKNHYGLDRMVARLKSTEILLIFFGIHTANAALLVRREAKSQAQVA